MNNPQMRQVNEAARIFAEAVQESFRITSERSEEAQDRTNRLTRDFFKSVARELQTGAKRNRATSQQLVEQSKKQQAAFRQMSEESMSLYRDFLGSISSYYRTNVGQARQNVQESARTGVQTATQATKRTDAPVRAASERHSGVPIEGYDGLNVKDAASRLEGLSDAELHRVREYEAQNKNRRTLLDQIDQKLAHSS